MWLTVECQNRIMGGDEEDQALSEPVFERHNWPFSATSAAHYCEANLAITR
jgi:hypothetical protein